MPGSLRERHKQARRRHIVATAAALWRAHGIENVTLPEIAEAAAVAPQTIYNLIGGSDALMFAVIETLLDRLDTALAAHSTERGVEQSLLCVRILASIFTEDPKLYRQLVVRLPQTLFSGGRFQRDSALIQVKAVARAQAEGDVRCDIRPELAGRHIFTGYMGALLMWASGGLGNAAFVRAAELAAATVLASCATPKTRAGLEADVDRLLGDGVKPKPGKRVGIAGETPRR